MLIYQKNLYKYGKIPLFQMLKKKYIYIIIIKIKAKNNKYKYKYKK